MGWERRKHILLHTDAFLFFFVFPTMSRNEVIQDKIRREWNMFVCLCFWIYSLANLTNPSEKQQARERASEAKLHDISICFVPQLERLIGWSWYWNYRLQKGSARKPSACYLWSIHKSYLYRNTLHSSVWMIFSNRSIEDGTYNNFPFKTSVNSVRNNITCITFPSNLTGRKGVLNVPRRSRKNCHL